MKNEKEKDKAIVYKVIILILICIIFAMFCILQGTSLAKDERKKTDANVIRQIDAKDSEKEEEDLSKLEEMVKEGHLRICINTNPIFKKSTLVGRVNVMNKEPNVRPIYLEIVLDDGRVIYESGLIPVGYEIQDISLSEDLEIGVYSATAYFHSVDEESGEVCGSAGARMYITVKE